MKKLFLFISVIFLCSCTLQRELKQNYKTAKYINENSILVSKWLGQYNAKQITLDELTFLIQGQQDVETMYLLTKKSKK